jgi:diguanylate cyclase (GGDEF)-like protein
MDRKAWLYVGIIYLLGLAITLIAFSAHNPGSEKLSTFLLLLLFSTLSLFYKPEAPSHQIYQPAQIYIFAGALLLNPFQFSVLIILSHLIEWIKERVARSEYLAAWYIQPFNICMHIIVGLTVQQVFGMINPGPQSMISYQALIGAAVAALVYLLMNHLIVGYALVLARGVSWTESGILDIENLFTDFTLNLLGYMTAVLCQLNPWLILTTLAPLYLICRALGVPHLKEQACKDAKTGLWNAEYFKDALDLELSRASRYGHSLTVVMADLDFLRNINNTYGHLGGDAVLIGVADELSLHFRDFDIVSRFGGEEFAILLPETYPQNAFHRIETIRERISKSVFIAPCTKAPISATMSFGIAGLNGQKLSCDEIIHQADIAVYDAKLKGRNRTSIYTQEIGETLGAI